MTTLYARVTSYICRVEEVTHEGCRARGVRDDGRCVMDKVIVQPLQLLYDSHLMIVRLQHARIYEFVVMLKGR